MASQLVRQQTEPARAERAPLVRQHTEPERPVVYEPPDLYGRKHVEKITGEYRVREDECLADKLQNEEFDLHFGKNKTDRVRGQIDIKTAKDIYLKEVEDSGLLSKAELQRLCKDDSFVADEVNRRLHEEVDLEAQRKAASEMQDEEFARYLEAKEKEKMEIERKKRLQRRIKQDRAAAERLQRELEAEAEREEAVSKGISDMHVTPSSQNGGWAIDFEVGTSSGVKTKQDLRDLKDAELTRELQLKEAELEKKHLEEDRDRKIAMKLQRAEAEEYRQAKKERERERELQREQSEKRHSSNSEDLVPDERRKRLQSVDASGKLVQTPDHIPNRQSSDRRHEDSNPSQKCGSGSRRQKEYVNGEEERCSSRKHQEPIYLQAVDATGRPIEQTRDGSVRSRDDIDKEEIIRQQQRRYNELHGAGERARSKSVKHRNEEPRLIDDQRALQQQMRQVDHIQQGKRDKSRQESKKCSTKSRPVDNSWGLEMTREGSVSKPSNNHYANVATNIDPTYSSITSLKRQNGGHEQMNEYGDASPTPVIQNVKRSNQDSEKKKKKWFSKKEKSK